jgi:hypothetical protein
VARFDYGANILRAVQIVYRLAVRRRRRRLPPL